MVHFPQRIIQPFERRVDRLSDLINFKRSNGHFDQYFYVGREKSATKSSVDHVGGPMIFNLATVPGSLFRHIRGMTMDYRVSSV